MISGSLTRMQATISALGALPAQASREAAARLQVSLDAVSDAKGRAHTGTATATPEGVAISVRTGGAEFVSDAWREIVTGAISDTLAKGGAK